MSLPVHLVDSLAGVAVGDEVGVEGDEAHHAVVVRRLRVGERVVLTDGAGSSVTGPITDVGKRRMGVLVEDLRVDPRPQPDLCVVQALPKGERGELAVEVLTEVGVATVMPWAAARSVAAWRGERATRSLARWRSTAREAAKQSRRTWHPEVADLADLDTVVERVRAASLALVLHEEAGSALAAVAVPRAGEVVLVVGPEGGLDPAEVAALEQAGALAVRLGAEVLRTSTAGVVAAAAVLSRTSRWA